MRCMSVFTTPPTPTPMRRRTLLATSVQLAMGGAASAALLRAHAQPSYPVSEAQLQRAVDSRFPLTYPVRGLLDLKLQAPRLRLLPEQNRLGAAFDVEASGPALHRARSGRFDLDFALRYEPRDLTIRAHQLRVNTLQLDGLAAQPSALLAAYGPALAEQALQDAVLHTLKPQDLALPDGMGLQPGSITVTAQGLVIGFVPKA